MRHERNVPWIIPKPITYGCQVVAFYRKAMEGALISALREAMINHDNADAHRSLTNWFASCGVVIGKDMVLACA